MKTRLTLFLLFSLTSAVFAQGKKTISVFLPLCEDPIVAYIVKGSLTNALAHSQQWQVIDREKALDAATRAMAAGQDVQLANLQEPQYLLQTEIFNTDGNNLIACSIIDAQSAAVVSRSTQICGFTLTEIQEAVQTIAQQLFSDK